jgi:hypothetical protein
VTKTTTTTTESFGTVTEFTPGDSLILKTEAAEPMHYTFSKTITYVNAHGKVIEASKIRKDSKVRVHYLKHGNDMVVDRIHAHAGPPLSPGTSCLANFSQASNSAPGGSRQCSPPGVLFSLTSTI